MIPSLLQIPSAVSDSKLHSVLPNNGKGDFTFDRSTGATRINKDGLIEEVGYFSSELVQNGNFSELGSELIANGNFETDSNWIKQTGWSINDGKAISNGSNAYLIQSSIVSSSPNKTFKVTFTVSNYVSGSFNVGVGGYDFYTPSTFANGEYTIYAKAINASSNNKFYFRGFNLYASIDNVSVKQVDPNDRWTLGTNTTYGDSKVILPVTSGGMQFISSNNANLTSGKLYKIAFTAQRTSGTGQLAFTDSSTNNITGTPLINSDGDFVFNFTPASDITGFGFKRHTVSGNYTWELSNISVVEVQGDRPRLSYDITNGVVEDKPHLLLEPSSTNLVTFSEDFSQSSYIKVNSTTIVADQIKAPDNTTTADLMKAAQTGSIQGIYNNISFTSGQSYAFSVFAKKKENIYLQVQAGGGTFGTCFANFDLENGVVGTVSGGTGQIEAFTNDWYRCIFIVSAISTGTGNISLDLISSLTAGRNDNFTGNVGDGLYIWGAMVEQQAFATSYIKTAGTTITRAAETCNNSKPSVNSTEGVLYAEIGGFTNTYPSASVLTISSGNYNNSVRIAFHTVINQIEYRIVTGGVIQAFARHTISDITQFNKIAVKYKANDFALWINGNQVLTDTSGSLPSAGTFNEVAFDDGNGDADFFGKVKGLAVYNEALTDAQLIELTS